MSAVSITDELPQLVGQDLAETPLELLPQLRGWVESLGFRVEGFGFREAYYYYYDDSHSYNKLKRKVEALQTHGRCTTYFFRSSGFENVR